jgi:predicted enzyme related to lactoylglutathione lyase
MSVKRLQNTYVAAGDFTESRRFYEDLLGLKPKFVDDGRWVQYDAGGTNFALGAPRECPEHTNGAVAVFEVERLDEHAAQLQAMGVEVLERRDMGGHGRLITILDPAGNYIQLFERATSA